MALSPLQRLGNALFGAVAPAPAPVVSAVGKPGTTAFELGQRGRRLAAIPTAQVTLNTLLARYGRTVVARSRYLCTNNAYAISAREEFCAAFAGTGVKPSTLDETPDDKKAIQTLWRDFQEQADADGLTDFYGLQGVAAGEMFEAGECFVQIIESKTADKKVAPFKLRLLPSEMLPFWHNATNGVNTIRMGIEFDPSGQRVAYWFFRQNPGDMYQAIAGTPLPYGQVRVPADEVLHMFRPIRAGQLRGIPHTLGALVTLAMMDLYDDAELERKRTAALFTAFVTRDATSPDDGDNPLGTPNQGPAENGAHGGGTSDWSMEPGAVVDLAPGENITFAEPADVGQQYEAFQYRNLLRAAAGFGVPYMSMTGDLRQANYGSIRAGLVAFRRRITSMQSAVMIHQLCRPVWNRFLDASTLLGLTPWTATEYLADLQQHRRAKWLAPRWDWVDPLKDQQAEKLAVDNGFKARSDTIEEEGSDAEEVDARILADQNREDELGLRINRFQVGTAAAAEVAAEQVEGGDGDNSGAPDAPPAPGTTAVPPGDTPPPAPAPAPAPAKKPKPAAPAKKGA